LAISWWSDELVDMLDEVYIPVGGLNAGQWWDRRRDKREKAREATVVAAIRAGQVDEFMVSGRRVA
jgi:hypothetical protein